MMAAVGRSAQVSSGQLAAKLSPPPLPGSSVKISQHVTLNITESIIVLEECILLRVCVFFTRVIKKFEKLWCHSSIWFLSEISVSPQEAQGDTDLVCVGAKQERKSEFCKNGILGRGNAGWSSLCLIW